MVTKSLHDRFVYDRRMETLSGIVSAQLHDGTTVLDVGCGDGKIDYILMQKKEVRITGTDVLVRDKTYIPVVQFDGERLPYDDGTFDTVLFIDVLHHIANPLHMLREAKRVAKQSIVIKDHLLKGVIAYHTLKLMDYFGNVHYGVNLPYNYLSKSEWDHYFDELQLVPEDFRTKLHLYPFPFSILFGRDLHFIVKLNKSATA